MSTPGHTWRGILEHLLGLHDFSGQNGLATFLYAKPNVDAVIVELSYRERFYGRRSTGISQSASVKIPTPVRLPGGGEVNASIGTKIGGLEVNGGLKGEWDILAAFRLGKVLSNKLPGGSKLIHVFDFILDRLPDIKGAGELAIYLGLSSRHIPYFRLQTGAGISFKLPAGIKIPGLNVQTNVRGAGGAIGRSWQIQLNHPLAYLPSIPGELSY